MSATLEEAGNIFCNKCGGANTARAAFCSSCGQGLQQLETVSTPTGQLATLEDLEQQVATLEREGISLIHLSRARFTLAVAYLRKEENAKATIQLRFVLAQNPEDALAHTYLGAALLEEYQVDEAKAELDQALLLKPDDAVVRLKMGEFCYKIGLIPEAVAQLEIAYRLPAPSRETAHYIYNLLQKARHQNKNILVRPNRTMNLNVGRWFRKTRHKTMPPLQIETVQSEN